MNGSTTKFGRVLIMLLIGLLPLAASGSSNSVYSDREWRFEVFLDEKPIGFHYFHLSNSGKTWQLHSRARFNVKILGITVYNYVHQSKELWQQDCLLQIEASTDINGEDFFVRGSRRGDQLTLENPSGRSNMSGCIMTFAYWNPAILEQERLLNVQTGEYLDVGVQYLGEKPLQIQDRVVPALHYRISAGDRDIELSYSADREWLGLSSTARGGRQLNYRRVYASPDTRSVSSE